MIGCREGFVNSGAVPSVLGPRPRRHGVITELMADVARAVLDTPGAGDDLRLGGANALSEFYLGHRLSADLDFFAMAPENLAEVSRQLPSRVRSTGLASELKVVRTGFDFHRFELIPASGGVAFQIDLGRWLPPQMAPPLLVDGIRVEAYLELALGKLLALIDRAEPRDAVDLWAICNLGELGLPDLIEAVYEKDPGLAEAPYAIAGRLQQVGKALPLPLPPLLTDIRPEVVQRWFAEEATAVWRRLRPDVTPRP